MDVHINFRVVVFLNEIYKKDEIILKVKRTLERCKFFSTACISDGLGSGKNNAAFNSILEVLEEILLFIDHSGNIESINGFITNWLQKSQDNFSRDFVPWLVVANHCSFSTSREMVHKIESCEISFGSLVSSSKFILHCPLKVDIHFFHDRRSLKICRYGIRNEITLDYAIIRHILVYGLHVLFVFSSSPTVKDAKDNDIIGLSNSILIEFPDKQITKKAIHRLHARSKIPLVFVPFQILRQGAPSLLSIGNMLPNFSCNYFIEALLHREFVLQIQGLKTFIIVAQTLASIDIQLLETSLTTLLLAVELSYPFSYQTALSIIFKHLLKRQNVESIPIFIPPGTKGIRRAIITPTRIILLPPEIFKENRILRNYNSDYALRVSFRDDYFAKLNTSFPLSQQVLDYIEKRLLEGLNIADRKYDFLAWSNSQLREHCVWMYARDEQNRTAEDIRSWMGDFSKIRNVPKLMARMGQCFTQTYETFEIPLTSINVVPDIKRGLDEETNQPYCFSDGIGRISLETVKKVCESRSYTNTPMSSAFQIRFAGFKGVLVLDPLLKDFDIVFRESMKKFSSSYQRLEIVKFSDANTVRLNRPLISILDHHGVEEGVFLHLQKNAILTLIEMLLDSKTAASYLQLRCNIRGLNFQDALDSGIDLVSEPFFRAMLLARHHHDIADLKNKNSLPIDPSEGRCMFGVLDETGTLQYGQVYVQYTTNLIGKKTNYDTTVLSGKVMVTKNPCHLAGDVRVFDCVDVPALKHIVDCIVFPQLGPRPHPNEMSGSDLDGDEYTVIWKKEFIFKKNAPAGQFPSPKEQNIDRVITVSDMVNFFYKFIKHDHLGQISNAHLAISDFEGVTSKLSLDVARCCSMAVDFPKTGIEIELPKEWKPKKFPDFMEKPFKETYLSTSALGSMFRIYRDLQDTSENLLYSNIQPDPHLEYPGWQDYQEQAEKSFTKYAHFLEHLMATYGVQHESEALSGAFSKIHSPFQEINETEKIIAIYIQALWKKIKDEFYEEFLQSKAELNLEELPKNENSSTELTEKLRKKASAWYMVTYQKKKPTILSFPWVMTRYLAQIKHQKLTELQQPIASDLWIWFSSHWTSAETKQPPILNPGTLWQMLNSELKSELKSEFKAVLLPEVHQLINKSNLPVFTAASNETLLKTTKVLLNWAKKRKVIVLPIGGKKLEGDIDECAVANILLYVASMETEDLGVIPLILSFFKFCSTEKTKTLLFRDLRTEKLSKKAMESYRNLAVKANLSALHIGESVINVEMVEMEEIKIRKKLTMRKRSDLNQFLKEVSRCKEVTSRPWGNNYTVINAYGPVNFIRKLESILSNCEILNCILEIVME